MCELVLVPFAFEVQNRSDAKQKVLGLVYPPHIFRSPAQEGRIGERRNPSHCRQITKRSRCFLDVGFELIERRVELGISLVDERAEGRDNMSVRAGVAKGRLKPVEEFAVAGNEPGVYERHQEFRIIHFEPPEFLDFADLVSDDEAEIPERVQNRTDQALFGLVEMAAEEQEQIDVRVKTELSSAVAADGNDGHRPVDSRCREKQLPQDPVEAIREPGECRAAAAPLEDLVAQLSARVVKNRDNGVRKRGCDRGSGVSSARTSGIGHGARGLRLS
jgi:hypothetical protein